MDNPQAERCFAEGVALHRQGRIAEAASAYARACELDPAHVAARFNQAIALQAQGLDPEAEGAYKAALALKPDLVQALNNLANLYLAHDRVAEALDALARATTAAPAFAPPWNTLGNALLGMGRIEEARGHFERALKQDPAFLEARMNLGRTLHAMGRPAEALPHLEAALAMRPGDASLQFLRDAASGAKPRQAPEEFVARLFDDMAANFDAHLVHRLGYRIPVRVAEIVGEWLEARARPRRVLDLGCGTGLVAEALRGRFEEMHGIDLSPNMVARARERDLYSTVGQGELVSFLAGRADDSADLVAATDVFIYVGDLVPVFAQAARVLAAGGRLAFSVEGGGPGQDYALDPTGRYTHADGYIRSLAATSGFTIAHASPETIRAERGTPVPGRLYVLATIEPGS